MTVSEQVPLILMDDPGDRPDPQISHRPLICGVDFWPGLDPNYVTLTTKDGRLVVDKGDSVKNVPGAYSTCRHCGRRRPARCFANDRTGSVTGLLSWCRDCDNARLTKRGKAVEVRRQKRIATTTDRRLKALGEAAHYVGVVVSPDGKDVAEYSGCVKNSSRLFSRWDEHESKAGSLPLWELLCEGWTVTWTVVMWGSVDEALEAELSTYRRIMDELGPHTPGDGGCLNAVTPEGSRITAEQTE